MIRAAAAKLRAIGWAEALLFCLLVAFLAMTRLFQPRIFWDDSYIHFRIALNWLRGEGFVYNAGEWIIPTTSPAYVAVLAIASAASAIEIPQAALYLNFLCEVGIVLLSLVWLKRAAVPLPVRYLLVLATLAEPLRLYFGVAGMEMGLYLLLTLGSFESLHRERWLAAGLMLGLLPWVRPEGVVVALAVAAALAVERKPKPLLKTAGVSAAVGLAFVAALVFAYGTFVPQSIRIKSVAPWYGGDRAGLELFARLSEVAPLVPVWISGKVTAVSFGVAAVQLILMISGARYLWKCGERIVAIGVTTLFGGTYIFYAITNPQITGWYLAPYFFCVLFLAGVGWWSAIEGGMSWLSSRKKMFGVAAACAVFTLILFSHAHRARVYTYYRTDTVAARAAFRLLPFAPGQYERYYVKAAEMLNEMIDDPEMRVGAAEIGVFGYYYEGKILDAYGLVSPETGEAWTREGPADFDAQLHGHTVKIYTNVKPEFVLSGRRFLWSTPSSFDAIYRESSLPGIPLRFFIRRDVAGSMEGMGVGL